MDQETLNKFDDFYDEFKDATENIDDEYRGILRSEAFFVRGLCGPSPKRIIESGRARGQSTYLLAKSLPNTKIISIEYDKDSVDSQFALERLSKFENVQCLFGDSRKLIPELVEDGDIVLIDGPKDMDALNLLAKLSNQVRLGGAFIHDAYQGSILRQWLSAYKPKLLYSDHYEYIRKYCHLDHNTQPEDLFSINDEPKSCKSLIYGGTFVFLNSAQSRFYFIQIILIKMYKIFYKIKRSFFKADWLNFRRPSPL